MFIFADADLKFDQPQAEVVFDRDKLRSQGVDLSQAGRDLSMLLGGDYVNRFSIQGRSYKVIPQIERAERLTPDQLSQIYITGSGDKLVPLSTFATLKTTAEPRELKKFQQLNAVRIQGVIPPPVPLDTALGVPRERGAAILPPGFTIDYAGESRQLQDGGRQLPRHVPAVGDPDLSGARGAVRELPRSVHHPRRLGAARGLRRAAVLVPRLDDAQHLQPGRPDHAGRPGREERHPDRAVREPPAGDRSRKARGDHRGGRHAAAADPDDDGGDRRRPFPAGHRDRSRRRRAQQHRHHARERHDHRHAVHAVRRALDLHAAGAQRVAAVAEAPAREPLTGQASPEGAAA